MASGDEYKRLATECVRLAQLAKNPTDKSLLLAMADVWLKLQNVTGNEGADGDKKADGKRA
jgi:hypothetical protein